MALARIENGRIVLDSEWRERELAKESGCRWDEKARCWHLPLSWAACCTLRGVFGDRLQVGQDLSDWAGAELRDRVIPCLELRQASELSPEVSVYGISRLDTLQAVGVEFLSTARQALCGDGMGSGKTIEAICAVETLSERGVDVFPCLIVCTNTMVWEWEKELRKWAPHRSVEVLKGGKQTRIKKIQSVPDYMVINWEGLSAHTRLSGYGSISLGENDKVEKELNEVQPRTVVADEAHRAKNPKTKQTRAWWYLSWQAENRFALTGTPLVKTPEDLWSIMHGLAPHEWPSKVSWVDRYGLKSWNTFGGLSVNGLRGDTRDELFKFLDPRFIRRPTNVVVPNIAEKLEPQVRSVDLVPKQRKAYDQMKKEMVALLDDGATAVFDELAKLTRLRQLACSWAEVTPEGGMVMTEPSCKVDAMEDILDELDEDPCVFFAESYQLIQLCQKRLDKLQIPYGVVAGPIPEYERASNVEKFQSGMLRAMLCTLGAGSEGITLTRARHVVFLERSYSLAKNKQAEDRVWRRGQDRPVQPIYVIARNTIEERVISLGEQREARFEEVVRDRETIRKLLEEYK